MVSKQLILIRGLPGSGKSTVARALVADGGLVFSTDDFWIGLDGKYRFNIEYIGDAHAWNRGRTDAACAAGESPIVIDNTNTTREEMSPFVAIALRYGYETSIVEPATPWRTDVEECHRRCSHGVSLEIIKKMAARWETV